MSIITLTRGQYSGGEEVAENVAKALGARCVSDEVLREAAKSYPISEDKMAQFFDQAPSLWDRLTRNRHVHAAYIKATLLGMCIDNNIVYHGNAGQELLREIPHALKVRIMLSFDLRAAKIMAERGYNQAQAAKHLRMIDADRTKRIQYYYDADWRDPTRYDLLIRLDHVTSEFVVGVIVNMAAQPGYQMTEAHAEVLRTVELKSRILANAAAILGSQIVSLNIEIEDGVVNLHGDFRLRDTYILDTLIEETRKLDGVTEVHNTMSAGMGKAGR